MAPHFLANVARTGICLGRYASVFHFNSTRMCMNVEGFETIDEKAGPENSRHKLG